MSDNRQRLQKALNEISNHIYVNDGVFKDRVFSDVVRILAIKIETERSASCDLLSPDYLDQIPDLELDEWAKSLLRFSIEKGIDTAEDARWNIKDSSLHWAAKQIALFELTNFPADVKGEAFQALVVNNLRGDRGEYFTPEPLVGALCSLGSLSEDTRVIDPAAGSGGFLYGAFRNGVDPRNLFGAELSNDVGNAAKTRVKMLGGDPEQIIIGNAFTNLEHLFGTFDSVLMNPPFGANSKIEDLGILNRFELPFVKSKNLNRPVSVAPEVLFLELAIKLLKPGGTLGTVIPDGILQNSSAIFVRSWLSMRAQVDSVISCPSVTFVPYGTGVKTSLLVMKKNDGLIKHLATYSAISQSVGYDARGKAKYLNEPESESSSSGDPSPRIDEDLIPITQEVLEFRKTGREETVRLGSTTAGLSDSNRWDAEFFDSRDEKFVSLLERSNYPRMSSVVDLVKQKVSLKLLSGVQDYVAIADLDFRTSQIVNIQNLDSGDLPSRASYRAQAGDVITALAGANTGTDRHVSAIIGSKLDGVIVSNGFGLLRPTGITPHQLLGYLRSDFFLRQIFRLRTGHAIPSVKHEELLNLYIPSLESKIWQLWEESVVDLDNRAESLFDFADEIRILGNKSIGI